MAATTMRGGVMLESCMRKLGLVGTENVKSLPSVVVRSKRDNSAQSARTVVTASASFTWNSRTDARQLRLRAASGETHTIRSVPVQVAKELVEAGHLLLDVRTPEEFSNGHVEGAINIPLMYRQNGGMTRNPEFLKQVQEQFNINDEVVVSCQSGKRSSLAVTELQNAGFSCLTDMGGGFGVWVESGLPVARP